MSFSQMFDKENSNSSNGGGLAGFDSAETAAEYTPLPPGVYSTRIVSGGLSQTAKGDDAYKVVFEVVEGPHKGRRVSRNWVFTAKAIGYAKRDLAVFGLVSSQQLLSPYPPTGKEVFVRIWVAMQRSDSGSEFNDVKRFEIIKVEDLPGSEFLLGSVPPPADTKGA